MQNTRIRKTYLYRYFNADSVLLYVGITRSISKRHSAHEQHSLWFTEHTKMTVEVFPSQHEAAIAEIRAIANEKPKYNVHIGGGGVRSANAFDTVIISVRLSHEEATIFDKIVKLRSSSRTAMLRSIIKKQLSSYHEKDSANA